MADAVSTAWRARSADATRPRRRLLALMLLALVAVAGTLLGLILWLSPPRPVALAPIWITTEPAASGIPGVVPWTSQDRAAILDRQLLGKPIEEGANPSRDQIRLRLKALADRNSREPVVLYLSAPANVDGAGQAYLIGADPVGDHPRNRIALTEVLELFRACPAEHRLVVLDLWPVANREATDPPAGTISAASLAALEATPDEKRLCLLSCDAGQSPLASPVLGRTLFGHYVSAGLEGAADGWNESGRRDGRVSVNELAAYARARVQRWSQAAATSEQSPRLVGSAADFALHPSTREEAIAFQERAPVGLGAYPDWLKAAWSKPGPALRAERAWAAGQPDAEVKREYEKATRADASRAEGPTPSIASLPASIREAATKLQESLKAAIAKAEAAPPAPGMWKELEPFKTQPREELSATAFAIIAQEPTTARLRQLDMLLTSQDETPRFAETLLLHRLAVLGADPALTARMLRIETEFEKASLSPALAAQAKPALDEAYRRWIAAQAAVFSPGYVSPEATEERLTSAADAVRRIASFVEVSETAKATLADAQRALHSAYPAFLAGIVSLPAADRLADAAASLHESLRDSGSSLTLDTASAVVDRRRERGSEVRSALATFLRPFSPAAMAALRERAAASDATIQTAHEIAVLLETDLVPPAERPALWDSYLALAKRFSNDVTRLDREEVESGIVKDYRDPREIASAGDRAPDTLAMQEQWAAIELRARGRKAPDVAQSKPPAARLEALRAAEQAASASTAAVDSGELVWAWQAGRFDYESHDPLGPDSGAAGVAFATDAARACRAEAQSAAAEPYLEFTGASAPLSPDATGISLTAGLRLVGAATAQKAALAPVTMFPAWSRASIDSPLELQPGLERNARLDVAFAGAPPGNGAKGVLLEGTLGGRTFHHRYPINLDVMVNALQIAVTNDPKAAPRAVKELFLRPHGETMPYHFYLFNPGPNPKALVVRLANLGVETKGFALGARDMALLQFPAPPAPPAAPGQPAGAPGLVDLREPLIFEVFEGEGRRLAQRIVLPVTLLDPERYLTVTDATYRPAVGGRPNALAVRVRPETPLDNPPCPIEIVFPAEANPGLMIRDGKLKGPLPTDGQPLRLYAEGLTTGGAPPTRLYVNLNTDGSERAFTFAGTVPPTGEAIRLTQVTEPLVRVRAPEFASGIKPLPVRIEADNAPEGSKLELRLGTYVEDRFVTDASKTIDTPRERTTTLGVKSPEGMLLLRGLLRDWETALPVDYLVGIRDLEARIVKDGKVLAESRVKVLFDSAPPVNIEFLSLPPKVAKEKPLAVRATSDRPVSSVKEVKFFYGKPVKGDAPQGAATVPGKLVDPKANVWEAVLPPTGVDGPITVTALFTSRAGLTGAGSQDAESMPEAIANKPEPAMIGGKVIEGRLPQADLVVVLLDDKGAEKGRVKTKGDGGFQFNDVPPGKYKLQVQKEITNRKAEADVDVKAGEEKKVTLELLL